MDTKFKTIKYLCFALLVASFSSCLKSGLDELPAFTDTKIISIFLEHRFYDTGDIWIDGSSTVKFQRLTLSNSFITSETSGSQYDSIVVVPSIPQANGNFTTAERKKVTLSNIVVYTNISTAATIAPLDNAPVLGKPGDFTVPRKYRVTAADGKTYRDWVIKIKPLPVINN